MLIVIQFTYLHFVVLFEHFSVLNKIDKPIIIFACSNPKTCISLLILYSLICIFLWPLPDMVVFRPINSSKTLWMRRGSEHAILNSHRFGVFSFVISSRIIIDFHKSAYCWQSIWKVVISNPCLRDMYESMIPLISNTLSPCEVLCDLERYCHGHYWNQ